MLTESQAKLCGKKKDSYVPHTPTTLYKHPPVRCSTWPSARSHAQSLMEGGEKLISPSLVCV